MNSDEPEKLREFEWLISTILLEINQLQRNHWSGVKNIGRVKKAEEPGAPEGY